MKYLKRKWPAIVLTVFSMDFIAFLIYEFFVIPIKDDQIKAMWIISPIFVLLLIGLIYTVIMTWITKGLDWK